MRQTLNRLWYGAAPIHLRLLLLLLLPMAGLFGLISGLRRACYRQGLLTVARLPVPVVVVGNLTVGGSGKTPLVLALVDWLREAGYAPGVISRGYAGRARAPMAVGAASDPLEVGDEPLLIARRAGCPVWIGRVRAEAGRGLLAAHPEVNVLIADDGLQHYGLARDLELVVVDGERGFGNRHLLPAGPLREPASRLRAAHAMVVNGAGPIIDSPIPRFGMNLVAKGFVSLSSPVRKEPAAHFVGRRLHALAGIGHPERFFRQLAALGLDVEARSFPDHHRFSAADLPTGTVLMTEKDAVKCAALAPPDAWFLAVDAEVEGGLQTLLLNALKAFHGSQAT